MKFHKYETVFEIVVGILQELRIYDSLPAMMDQEITLAKAQRTWETHTAKELAYSRDSLQTLLLLFSRVLS